jgi:hypothetical protein
MTDEDKIKGLVGWFFEKINRPIVDQLYIHDSQNWDALCASLTLLNDLQRAKAEFYLLKKLNHLEAIGIMQTAYIEQDCMLTLKNAIFEKKETTPLIKYKPIRELRNEAFGHPAAKGKNGMLSRHFFDIEDDKKQLLKIINWENIGNITSRHFSLTDEIRKNSKITKTYLEEFKDSFITKIKNHMLNYKVQTKDLFNHTGYVFEKLLSLENDKIAIDSYKFSVDGEIEKAKGALQERKVFQTYKREIEVSVFFSEKLKPLFYRQTYKDVEFYAYATSLRKRLEDLRKSLTDIDKVF